MLKRAKLGQKICHRGENREITALLHAELQEFPETKQWTFSKPKFRRNNPYTLYFTYYLPYF